MRRDFVRYWLLALAWTAVILYASSDAFSAQNTGSILEAVVTFLFGHVQRQTFATLHFLARKSAHVIEYGILGLVWFRAWRGRRQGFAWKWAWLGLGVVLATAIVDEVHQSFVPSRTGEVSDVFLDVAGALAAQMVLWGAIRWKAMRVSYCPPERLQP
ncbi:MAG TPA: VanZ family protein [Terriglobales bacterium]|nr:VanZ family protein [Terriglobales bacterium]